MVTTFQVRNKTKILTMRQVTGGDDKGLCRDLKLNVTNSFLESIKKLILEVIRSY